MKLLIVTQVIDTEHPILGFFHRWVEEFAKHCEHVNVIALQVGTHSLPANVTVHSLGKEQGSSKFSYLFRFYKLIWSLRHEYDNVFVHMNQIYVILGAPFWRLMGKKVGLWYMHGSVPLTLKIAEKMTNIVYTGSPESFKIKSKKVVVTGHGIDTVRFAPQDITKDLDLITVGRITPVKNLHTLIDIFTEIRKSHDVTLTIISSSVTEEEKKYESELRQKVSDLNLEQSVIFAGKVSQENLPTYLNRAKIFVTVAQNGSLDKAVLEAMACGLEVVSMAPGTSALPLGDCQTQAKEDFKNRLEKMVESGFRQNVRYVDYVAEKHSLESLIPTILKKLS